MIVGWNKLCHLVMQSDITSATTSKFLLGETMLSISYLSVSFLQLHQKMLFVFITHMTAVI